MKNFKAKNFLAALALGGTILFGGMAQPVAEAGIVTDRLPFQCYVDHQVDTYNQPNGQRVGYISANVDLVQVTQVRNDGWAYGSYPGKNGRVTRWFRITELCADPSYSNRGATVQGAQRVFRTKNSGDTIGSVSNNESVIVLADNGNRAQILYRLDNGTGYKVGWVPSSAVDSRRGNSNSSLKGDVNGDGRVDNNDVELMRKYMVGLVSESQINKANADMNGNGTIDISDFAMLSDKIDNQSNQSQVNHNPQGTVQVAEGTAPNTLHVRGTAFDEDNPNASTRLHVYVGGGAGSGASSYEIRTNGGNRVFDDTRNVGRSGNQHVYVYALNDYGSGENKEIWNGYVNIPGDNPVPVNLQNLINTYNNKTWRDHTYLPNVKECKEFASFIFNKLYGIGYIGGGSTSDNPKNYLINISNPNRVALRSYKTNLTAQSARELFQSAQPGDFVQIRRRHGGPHSGIFVNRTNDGIILFEANEDGRNSIRTNSYSYGDLANRNFAMSLYYAK